jgi:HD-GYP domain-containing protein (c-di-GMP phosphodiesterase class II)
VRVEQIQVEVDRLTKGMYVCALDRPWLSTPFPFQGFIIRSVDDVGELKKYCNYVYVDVLRGVAPEAEVGGLNRAWVPNQDAEDSEVVVEGGTPVQDSAPTEELDLDEGAYEEAPGKISIKALPIPTNPGYYDDPKNFRRELKRAEQIHGDLSRATSQIIDDLRVGRGLDVTAVRRSINGMIGSVVRHPDAFIWMTKLRQKDVYSYAHSVRCSVFSIVMARHMGLQEHKLEQLALGTLLCEVGKTKLPQTLLGKRDPINDEEKERLHSHVTLGVELLDSCVGLNDDVIEIVANHHERFDGSGYPYGRTGDEIPVMARIAGMVDCYDAMISLKPYTERVCSTAVAMDYLYDQRDVLFQGQLVEEFIQAIGIYPTGTLVELNNGAVALIHVQNARNRIQPEILLVLDRHKKPVDDFAKIDMRDYNQKHDYPLSIKRALTAGEFGLDPNQVMASHHSNKWDWRKLAFN